MNRRYKMAIMIDPQQRYRYIQVKTAKPLLLTKETLVVT